MSLEITPQARVVYASPSLHETFGYTPEQLVGRNTLELLHPEDSTEVDAIRATVFGSLTSAMLCSVCAAPTGPGPGWNSAGVRT